MDKLFMMRHGKYDGGRNLSQRGIEQVKHTVGLLKEELGEVNGQIHILDSGIKRSIQTGDVIKDVFPQSIRSSDWYVFEEYLNVIEYKHLMEKLEQLEGIVLISGHLPLLENFPRFFNRDHEKEFKDNFACDWCTGYGQGHYYDLVEKAYKHIPNNH